jgi:hypothetical protein
MLGIAFARPPRAHAHAFQKQMPLFALQFGGMELSNLVLQLLGKFGNRLHTYRLIRISSPREPSPAPSKRSSCRAVCNCNDLEEACVRSQANSSRHVIPVGESVPVIDPFILLDLLIIEAASQSAETARGRSVDTQQTKKHLPT